MNKQKSTPGTRQMVKVVGDLIQQFANQGTKNTISVADFLRLLAVYKELDAQRSVREVKVKWVGREKAQR